MGKPTPVIEDIEMPSLKAEFRLDDSVLAFKNLGPGTAIGSIVRRETL